MKESSLADRCRRNGWKKGTKIRCSLIEWFNNNHEDFVITAIGRHEVLGMRIDLPPQTTSGEEIIRYAHYDHYRKLS